MADSSKRSMSSQFSSGISVVKLRLGRRTKPGPPALDRAVSRRFDLPLIALLVVASVCPCARGFAQAIDPAALAGVAWVKAHQNANGSWGVLRELIPRDTARSLRAQLLLGQSGPSVLAGDAWLAGQQGFAANEFLSEQALALASAKVDSAPYLARLAAQRSASGPDFGGFVSHTGDTFDSALAIQAFATREDLYATTIGGIISTILPRQNADGGWGFDQGFDSHPVFTGEVLIALTTLKTVQPPPAVVGAAQQYLAHLVQSNGSLGLGSVLSTALAYRALALSGYPLPSLPASPLGYLKTQQMPDGSWGVGDTYLTARVLEAFAANKPNLLITPGSLTVSPTSVAEGGTVTANLTVANDGAVSAPATSVAVTFASSPGVVLTSASVQALAPGASQTLKLTFAPPTGSAGSQRVVATVDPNKLIDELRKDDNQASAPLTVTGKPDLQIFANDITTNPARLQPNQPGNVLVTIHNNGTGDAANVGYAVYQVIGTAQQTLQTGTIPAIAMGTSQVVQVPVNFPAGTYTILAVADPNNLIAESDETNNRASRAITVTTTSNVDLYLASDSVTATPPHPSPGQLISISVRVANLGTDHVDSSVALYDGAPGAGGSLFAMLPVSLDGQAQATLSATYSTTPSTQVIYAVADPTNTVAELDETNNVAYVPLTDQAVDLVVTRDGLVLPKTPLTAGQTVTARVVVANVGLLPAAGAKVVVYDDLPQNGGVTVANTTVDVPAGGKVVVTASWTARTGQRLATAVVNPDHTIVEQNYANDRATKAYVVSGSGPDIWIDTSKRSDPLASINVSGLVVDPNALTVSGIVKLTIHQASITQPYTVTVFEDVDGDGAFNPEVDNPLGSSVVQPGIDPETIQIVVAGTVRFAPGHLMAYLDSGNAIAESNESNNFVDLFEDCVRNGLTYAPGTAWNTPGLDLPSLAPVVRMLDTNGDGVIDGNDIPIVLQMASGAVYARRGDTGQVLWAQGGMSSVPVPLAIGDVDGDGHVEIIAHADVHRLVCLADDGHVKWTSQELDRDPNWDLYIASSGGTVQYRYDGAAAIADLDGDGHPEVISGRTVLDGASGAVKWVGTAGRGRAWSSDSLYLQGFIDQEQSIAVDLDGDGKLEVVAGNTAYRSNGTIYWYRSDLPDGYTAPVFLPNDPVRKVCLVANGNVYLLNGTDGTTRWGPVPVPGGALMGGAPTIFMNGTAGPYIGVAGDGSYSVLRAQDGGVVWTRTVAAAQPFNTALNSATAFDFGGGMTLVYNSMDSFFILRASDGTVLYQQANAIAPYYPGSPAVCDVDGNGRAEVVVPGKAAAGGLRIVGDPTWGGAPTIFNEASYHVVNVTEAGAIPVHETDTSLSRVQYRDNISFSLPASQALPNLTTSYVRVDGSTFPYKVTITARVGNMGWAAAPAGVNVAFYNGVPGSGGVLLGVVPTSGVLTPSGYEDVAFTWNNPPQGTYTFYVVADDNGHGVGSVAECNEGDNTGHSQAVALTSDIAGDPNSFIVSDTYPRQGDTISLSATAVLIGSVDATPIYAQFYAGDPTMGGVAIGPRVTTQIVSRNNRKWAVANLPWTVDAAVGPLTLACVFDPDNLIQESNETNNTVRTQIEVSIPDPIEKLSASVTLTPPSAEPGAAVTVAALVQNIGNVPLANVVVSYTVTAGSDPSPLFTGTVTLPSLAKFAYAQLSFGTFTPTQAGTYTVTFSAADPAVTIASVPAVISIAPFAGAQLSVVPSHVPVGYPLIQCHLKVSRQNTINVPDDPLMPVIKAALQRGVNWEAPAVRNYGLVYNCYLCHVQAQGLAGLEASRRVSGVVVDDATSKAVYDQTVSFQTAQGNVFPWQDSRTTTTLAAWSFTYWHDQVQALPHLTKALDYLIPRQASDGTFNCDDCRGSFGNPESMTMMAMMAYARGFEATGDSRYLATLTRSVQWALNYPYESAATRGAQYAARVAIGLAGALPQITDPNLNLAMKARLQSIATFLRSLQNPDGSFGNQASPDFPIIRTAQSLYGLALAGSPGTDPSLRASIIWLLNHQQSNGGWCENRADLYNQALWLDETTWAMIALPTAFLRLGQFDADASVTVPATSTVIGSNTPPIGSTTVPGGTQLVWHFPNVTETGSDLYLNLRLNGLAVGETRAAVGTSSLSYADPYTGSPISRDIPVPAVTGIGALTLKVSTDKPAYGPGENVTITEAVTDIGSSTLGITNDLAILDANGTKVATVAAGDPVTGLPAQPFPGWHFAVPVTFTVQTSGVGRIAQIPVSFTNLLAQLSVSGTFDRNSIRVSGDGAPEQEWYFAYTPSTADPAAGQLVVSLPDVIAPGTAVSLHVFFDVAENGLRPASLFDQSVHGPMGGNGLTSSYWRLDTARTNPYASTPDGLVFQQPALLTVLQPTSAIFSTAPSGVPQEYWGTVWTGALFVPTAGTYQFLLGSDDGMWFYLDGSLVLANPGLHPTTEVRTAKALDSGFHTLRIVMFNWCCGYNLYLKWAPPGQGFNVIPQAILYTAMPAVLPSAIVVGTPALMPVSATSLTYTWNTGATMAGPYTAVGVLHQNGSTAAMGAAAFTITPAFTLDGTIATDKPAYDPRETVHVSAGVVYTKGNTTLNGLKALVSIAGPGGTTVASQSVNLPQMTPALTVPVTLDWFTGTAPPGVYHASLVVTDSTSNTLVTRSVPFTVRSTADTGAGLSGTISCNSPVNQGELVTFSVTITNGGNADIVDGSFAVQILDPQTQALVDTVPFTASIAAGATTAQQLPHETTHLAVQKFTAYLVSLITGQAKPLANTPFEVISPPLQLDLKVGGPARVLLWANCSPGNSGKACTPIAPPFLTQTLTNAGIPYVLVGDEYTFLALLRTGAFSAAIIYQPAAAEPKIAPEYLQDIRAGIGLLFINNSPDAMPKLAPALATSFKGKLHGPTTLDLLQTPFTAPTTLALNGDGVRIELAGATAAAVIDGSGTPAISYNTYGAGHVVVVPFDTELTQTTDVASFLVAAVRFVSLTPVNGFVARQVVPLDFEVTTPPGGSVTITLGVTLPSGMQLIDALPPLNTTTPPSWSVTIDGNTHKHFFLWVRLPDTLGTFTVTASAGFGSQPPIVTTSLDLTVVADRSTLANQLAADLQALKNQATGKDLTMVSDAIAQLDAVTSVQNPDSNGVLTIIQEVLAIVGDLQSISLDTSVARRDADALLLYWQSRA